MKPTYPHIVCSLGFACAFAFFSSHASAGSDKIPGKSHRIAEAQQETTITGMNGRQTTVKSTTLFLTGPEARISETPATTPVTAEKKADAPFANAMATGEKDLAAKSAKAAEAYLISSKGVPKKTEPPGPDMTSLLPKLIEVLKSGDITTIKGFLKQNAGVTKATFTNGSLKTNTLNVAVRAVPASEERIEVFRLLVKGGAGADFIETHVNDPGIAYNVVSYPEILTVEELDFLLGAGADPDCGVCVPKTPPILSLCNMMFGEKGGRDTTLTKQEALDRIKVFVKHKANPAKLTGIATELTVNGTELKPTSAAQLATESGCEELKSALGLK